MRFSFKYLYLCLIISIALIILLFLENLIGIGWDFHPDAKHYLENANYFASKVYKSKNFFLFINTGYYLFVDFLKSNLFVIAFFNVLFYLVTNLLIFSKYKNFCMKNNYKINLLLFLLIALNPYKMHLSIHVLKDTFIIFLIVLTSFKIKYFLPILFLPLTSLRTIAGGYFTVFIEKKYYRLIIFISFPLIILNLDNIISGINFYNSQIMQLRNFDSVPTFQSFGILGSLMRAALWPFLLFYGIFALISPAPLYVPVAIGIWMELYFRFKRNLSIKPLNITYLLLFLLAIAVTGFTAYIRYSLPILTLDLISRLSSPQLMSKNKNFKYL
tara:strand:+ start:9808 stop:10794 length:987 start_codon:yes stop_codon:yes gene_type:complete